MMGFSWTGRKRSAQEPGNKEFDMDIRLYLSLNQRSTTTPSSIIEEAKAALVTFHACQNTFIVVAVLFLLKLRPLSLTEQRQRQEDHHQKLTRDKPHGTPQLQEFGGTVMRLFTKDIFSTSKTSPGTRISAFLKNIK